MRADLEKVLFHETTILARLDQLAESLTRELDGKDVTAVVILNGGMILMADLLRRIQIPLRIESLGASSYHGGTESSGVVKLLGAGLPDVRGKHVLLLDDIADADRNLLFGGDSRRGEGSIRCLRGILYRWHRIRHHVNIYILRLTPFFCPSDIGCGHWENHAHIEGSDFPAHSHRSYSQSQYTLRSGL
jgi:hypoxanthine phosphoribosyltransferase